MIDALYHILIGSLLIVGIALVWVVIAALVIASAQQMRRRK